MIDFGIYLKSEREKQGLSLKRLGALVGVSGQYIRTIEQGTARPSAALCGKLAKVLGLCPDVVFGKAGHMPPDVAAFFQANPTRFCALLRQELGHLTARRL